MQDKARILIVADEEYYRKMISSILTMQNYSVAEARNGEEALGQLEVFLPDLILIDAKMPRMNGSRNRET